MANRHAIIVMGMHRSGTSATTRVLNLLGLQLNNEITPAYKYNPTGYWEASQVTIINDEILKRLDSSWDDILPLPANWENSDKIKDLYVKAENVLINDVADSEYYLLKDPRLCKLMPFWQCVFVKLGFDISYVCITRHPLEVMTSHATRDQFSHLKSSLLWLNHVVGSEIQTRNAKRVFITYEQLLSDWRQVANRISEQLTIQFPIDPENAKNDIIKFLQPDMRHHIKGDHDLQNNTYCQNEIQHWYQALVTASEDNLQPLSQLTDTTESIIRQSLHKGLQALDQQLAQSQQQSDDAAGAHHELQQVIDNIYKSRSWRITKPLRKLCKSL